MQNHTFDLGASLSEHGPFLTRLSRSLLRDSHAAEDLVQDTWLAVLENGPERAGGIGGWLNTALRNRAISGFRKRSVRGEAATVDELDAYSTVRDTAPSPAETAERLEIQRAVHAALTDLAEPRRTTLMLRFHGGLTIPEIARRMDVPVPTVKSRLASGLSELRKGLDSEYGGGDEGRAAWGALLMPVAATRIPGESAGAEVMAQAGQGTLGMGGLSFGNLGGGLALLGAACGVALLAAMVWRAVDGRVHIIYVGKKEVPDRLEFHGMIAL